MKILIQLNSDRDCAGLANNMPHTHEVVLWNPAEDDIRLMDVDAYIFTESDKLGFDVAKTVKDKPMLFFKCKQPSVFKRQALSVEAIPPCADLTRYPVEVPQRSLACDIFFLSNWAPPHFLNQINVEGKTFRAAGSVPLTHPGYIGRFDSPNEVSRYCLSAGVCIDSNLECAYDLAKIGCRVITDTPNSVGIPTFNASNINEVIFKLLNEKKPVLNPYESKIMTYANLAENVLRMLS